MDKGPMMSIAILSKGYVETLDFKVDFPFPGPALVDPDCVAKGNDGDCKFYKCFEEQRQCGSDGILLGFGYNSCKRFGQFYSRFTKRGKAWIDCIKPCITKALVVKYNESLEAGQNCTELQTETFEAQETCYQDCGFCDVYLPNFKQIRKVVSIPDSASDDALKQVVKNEIECVSDLLGTDDGTDDG
ncbi:Hypothetical predicted protein [Mytilus galloprovincialis]|uniref:Stanniocalcin-like protein n=1 Tax=Mytilus galloprovincialis TaxID=29158 RepID=A0A8B6F013_MYTGA|nr:Hypothetical predicted protein [Mytilus galloprovincialis]